MPSSTLRLFFALWPDPPRRAALGRLAASVAEETGGRATATENVHLTLAFLGAQPRESVGELTARARNIAAAPFVLELDHVDCWRRNDIAWAGASRVPRPLAALRGSLAASLTDAGIALDPRPFAVHVTLARRLKRTVRRALAPPLAWPVDRWALVASMPGRGGPEYRVLERLEL
ncbi:MAG TPA: RNA 2',3'-cyclic phosphodiesterase [Casimicrobiaceae bacterium]|nr:RNA 2',3'-cyclic phosphodiesterase [Casimicrobiaceae bacterium]